jgi:hypothetical protein
MSAAAGRLQRAATIAATLATPAIRLILFIALPSNDHSLAIAAGRLPVPGGPPSTHLCCFVQCLAICRSLQTHTLTSRIPAHRRELRHKDSKPGDESTLPCDISQQKSDANHTVTSNVSG